MGLDSYLPLKKSGQSVIDRNLPYRFLRRQPLKFKCRSVFPLPLLFSRLSTMLLIDREVHEIIPLQFPRCFSLKKKTVREKLLSFNVCKALAKRWGCKLQARNSHTSVTSYWMYHFSHLWKTYRSRFWLDVSCFFLRVKSIVRSFHWRELIGVWKFKT